MPSKFVYNIGSVKFSKKENALGKIFFKGVPFITTISRMTPGDYISKGDRSVAKLHDTKNQDFDVEKATQNHEWAFSAAKNYDKAIKLLEAKEGKGKPNPEISGLYLKRSKAYEMISLCCGEIATFNRLVYEFMPGDLPHSSYESNRLAADWNIMDRETYRKLALEDLKTSQRLSPVG